MNHSVRNGSECDQSQEGGWLVRGDLAGQISTKTRAHKQKKIWVGNEKAKVGGKGVGVGGLMSLVLDVNE